MNTNSFRRSALMFFALLIVTTSAHVCQAQAQTVWTACTWDTSSIYKTKDGKEKFERRFYVTDLIATTTQAYVALTSGVPGLESVCGKYLEQTVRGRTRRTDRTGHAKSA